MHNPATCENRYPHGSHAVVTGDTAIRVLTTAVVLAVAAFAAVVSYSHIYDLGHAHGQSGMAARMLPLSVDGLILAASLVALHEARRRHAVPPTGPVHARARAACTDTGVSTARRTGRLAPSSALGPQWHQPTPSGPGRHHRDTRVQQPIAHDWQQSTERQSMRKDHDLRG
jgi:hypothetical protein